MVEKREVLKQNLEVLDRCLMRLSESFLKCKAIGIKDEFSEQELTEFEALTARFARTIDWFVNKALRSLYKVELEEVVTVLDLLNNAEKREIIDSAETWEDIKDLRNSIIHDYDVDDFTNEIFKPALQYTSIVERSVAKLKSYCEKYFVTAPPSV